MEPLETGVQAAFFNGRARKKESGYQKETSLFWMVEQGDHRSRRSWSWSRRRLGGHSYDGGCGGGDFVAGLTTYHPPINFTTVEDRIYRSGSLNLEIFRILIPCSFDQSCRYLCTEPYPTENLEFLNSKIFASFSLESMAQSFLLIYVFNFSVGLCIFPLSILQSLFPYDIPQFMIEDLAAVNEDFMSTGFVKGLLSSRYNKTGH
ncbi:hypothetical protein L6452_26257 [Arctium lappa]|uniref:Uncharacterized protein n=1 Tax=Arctium lappa TaxID=4217 RepID=A0ACB9ACF6_ARCLA|nr:hypothetical protein L6452_26257 [Arctium lappa]